MASGDTITISGHVESTVYHRDGREWVSLDGKEVAVYEYRPGTSQTPLKVIQRNEIYQTVQAVPTTGVYSGTDIMERISHDISVFWTKLSSVMDTVEHIPEIDVNALLELSDIMFSLAHTCGSEIEKGRSYSRSCLLEAEESQIKENKALQELKAHQNKLDISKKTMKAFSSALKHVLSHPDDKQDIIHHISTEKDVSVTDLVKECRLDINQQAEFPFFSKLCNFPIETKFSPIHTAALSGNTFIMKELYELDSSVAEALTGDERMNVLEVSAFGSLECFELCKRWPKLAILIPTSDQLLLMRDNILKMAAMGGNFPLIESLIPSANLFSVAQYQREWIQLLGYACIGGNLDILNWLTSFKDAQQFLSEDTLVHALSKVNGKHLPLDCIRWMVDHGLSSKRLLTDSAFNSNKFQNYMSSSGRADILEWLSTLKEFDLKAKGPLGMTLMHSACMANSVGVLKWSLGVCLGTSSTLDAFNILDDNGNHLVHLAAGCGSLDCLKWICSYLPQFQHVRGSRYLLSLTGEIGRTVSHFSVFGGDLATMEWLYAVHGAEYANSSADRNGLLPIHYAWEHLGCLKWMIEVAKCDLKSRDKDGWQLLHYAVLKDKLSVVDFIVTQLGPSSLKNPIPSSGRSAVHFIQSIAMGEFLWKCGADLSASDRSGKTLLDIQPSLRPWIESKRSPASSG